MSVRTVHCDFCNAVLVESGWECGCASFDYADKRQSLGGDPALVDGSLGSWLACDECARLVRARDQPGLMRRSAKVNMAAPVAVPIGVILGDLLALHEGFWQNHTGVVAPLTRADIAEIAREPATTSEWRPD